MTQKKATSPSTPDSWEAAPDMPGPTARVSPDVEVSMVKEVANLALVVVGSK